MSEFTTYDFRSIDRALTSAEMKEVNRLSSHIKVSSHKAVVSYSFGDFKHNPERVVEQYFDLLLYQSSYGQKQLIFKLPKDSVDYDELKRYEQVGNDFNGCTASIEVRDLNNFITIVFEFEIEEGDEWIDENGTSADEFIPLWRDIMNSDFSSLYAFWLKIQALKHEYNNKYYDDDDNEEDDDESYFPSLPNGLAKPSQSLLSFMQFFDIDKDEVAAAGAFVTAETKESIDYQSLINELSEREKTQWLIRLLNCETLLDVKLKKTLTTQHGDSSEVRTILSYGQVLEKVAEVKNKRLDSEKNAADVAHSKRMNEVQKNEVKLWVNVTIYLETKGGSSYDNAAKTLKDLYDMSLFFDKKDDFILKFKPIYAQCQKSTALMVRFSKLQLPTF
jgi:hypothetical protein